MYFVLTGVLLGGVIQAACSAIRWVVIHECHKNATTEDVPDVYYKFTAALFGFLQAIAIQVIVTHYYIYAEKREKVKSDNIKEWNVMATKFLKCLPGMIPYILLFFLILLSIASITFGLVYDLHLDNCSYSRHQKAALWIYHFLLLFTIVSIDIVLFKLVLATLYVSYIWAPENLPPDDHERSCNDWNEYLELKKHTV